MYQRFLYLKNMGNQKSFFDVEKNVREYIEMCDGMDGASLIAILQNRLKANSNILELGMGPGKDLDILDKTYKVTGSDHSQIFLDIYRKRNPGANLLLLDAVDLDTDKKFDCIYSNKVLHHLKTEDLRRSLKKQRQLLNPKGILFHTFWRGEKSEKFRGLRFIQYKMNFLKEMIKPHYRLLEIDTYEEMIANDSIYLILKLK